MQDNQSDKDLRTESPTQDTTRAGSLPLFEWEAKEYVEHERNRKWYALLVLIALGLIALAVFVRSWIFVVVVIVMFVALLISIKRPIATLRYEIYDDGVAIDGQLHLFDEYRSFGVVKHANEFALQLAPRKRLGIGDTLYFREKDGEKIVDLIGERLPMENIKPDLFDEIIHRLRL